MAIHCEPRTVRILRTRPLHTVDCRVFRFRSLLAMTKLCILPLITTLSSRGRKPVAIHCEPVSEPYCPYAPIAYSGLPRPSLAFPPRNDKVAHTTINYHLVIARAKPVAIHCDPVSEPYSPYVPIAYSGLPGPSLRSILARTLTLKK